MKQALWYLIKVAVLVAVALWLIDHDGAVVITWQGYIVNTSVAVLVFGIVAAALILALAVRLWRGLVHLPRTVGEWRRSSRRERGYQALTQGMVALAAGDPSAARKHAREADQLLRDPPLSLLLSAQAAQLAGDDPAAQSYFTRMLAEPETEFLGVRGLLSQAVKAGRRVEALELARRAHGLRPQAPWVLTTLFELEARAGHWQAAETVLHQALRAGVVAAAEGRQRRAVLLLAQSWEAESQGRWDEAWTHAAAAHDLAPGSVPAAARLAAIAPRIDKVRAAVKAVERTWRTDPHPALAEAYQALGGGIDAPAQVKRMQRLAALAADSVEGLVAVARAALTAGQVALAEDSLKRAVNMAPTRRLYHALAAVMDARHDAVAAADYRTQAAGAAPDPVWVCGSCGTVAPDWRPLCGHCGGFDTVEWRLPDAQAGASLIASPVPMAELQPVSAA